MTDHRPALSAPITVTPSGAGLPYQSTVTRHLGQWVYVDHLRFHVNDDRINARAWMTSEALFTLASTNA